MCVLTQDFTVSLQPDSECVLVCPGDSVEVNCTSTTQYLLWKLNVPAKNICEMQEFTSHQSSYHEHYQLYGVSLTLVSNSNGELISASRVEDVGLNISGSILTCSSSIAEVPQANEMISITILVEGNSACINTCTHSLSLNALTSLGPPSSPMSLKFFPQSLTSAVVSWTPPNDGFCITNYVIYLRNITEGNRAYTYNTTTNTTSMTVSELTQGAEYSFRVAGVDAKGGIGKTSVPAETVTFESELKAVTNKLMFTFKLCISVTMLTLEHNIFLSMPVMDYN